MSVLSVCPEQVRRQFHATLATNDRTGATAASSMTDALVYVVSNLAQLPLAQSVLRAGSAWLPSIVRERWQPQLGDNDLETETTTTTMNQIQHSLPCTRVDTAAASPACEAPTNFGVSPSLKLDVSLGPRRSTTHRSPQAGDRTPPPTPPAHENALGLVFDTATVTQPIDGSALAKRRRSRPLSVPTWQPAATIVYSRDTHGRRAAAESLNPFDPRFSPPIAVSQSSAHSSRQSPPPETDELPPTPPSPQVGSSTPTPPVTWSNMAACFEDEEDDDDEYFSTPPTFASGPGSPLWTSPPPPPSTPRHGFLHSTFPNIRQRPTLPSRRQTNPLTCSDNSRGRSPKSDACARIRPGRRRSPPRPESPRSHPLPLHESNDADCAIVSDSEDELSGEALATDERFVDIRAIRRQRSSHALTCLACTSLTSPSPPPAKSLALVSTSPDWTAATMHRKRSKSLFFGEQWRMYALGKENERRTGEGYWASEPCRGAGWVDLV
ncbi:hypothetical protein OIV83_004355 [Microbotryomycetes sp. JL201]|nr:hypothetical protein OIV83_004270 [Microbotryomycetes sp. JL201]KAK4049206.1 hypothetical protein OIV83_004355 [Microbotryomycetes sp. JL201]